MFFKPKKKIIIEAKSTFILEKELIEEVRKGAKKVLNKKLFSKTIPEIRILLYKPVAAQIEGLPFSGEGQYSELVLGYYEEKDGKPIVSLIFSKPVTKENLNTFGIHIQRTIEHELIHHLEGSIWPTKEKLQNRYTQEYTKSVNNFIFLVRIEGVAFFGETERELDYRTPAIITSRYEVFQRMLRNWDNESDKEKERTRKFFNIFFSDITTYSCAKSLGEMMCYTIAFARENVDPNDLCIKALKLQDRKLPPPQLSINTKERVIKDVQKMSHLGFLKAYEHAAEQLNIPKHQMLLTQEMYNTFKLLAYKIELWIAQQKKTI